MTTEGTRKTRAEATEPLSVDPSSIKALAHPLRVRMYDLLGDEGPATASQLAERLGESSGTTSYHLRLLAKHGFIEEDPEQGNKRDRYWKVRGYNLESSGMMDDPDVAADLRVAAGEIWRTYARQIEGWFRSAHEWGSEWASATVSSLTRFEATREDMIEIRDAVLEVLQAQAKRAEERVDERDADEPRVRVAMQFHLFPLGTPPEEGAGGPTQPSGDSPPGPTDPSPGRSGPPPPLQGRSGAPEGQSGPSSGRSGPAPAQGDPPMGQSDPPKGTTDPSQGAPSGPSN